MRETQCIATQKLSVSSMNCIVIIKHHTWIPICFNNLIDFIDLRFCDKGWVAILAILNLIITEKLYSYDHYVTDYTYSYIATVFTNMIQI